LATLDDLLVRNYVFCDETHDLVYIEGIVGDPVHPASTQKNEAINWNDLVLVSSKNGRMPEPLYFEPD
jgi:hypothetical protein